MPQRVQLPRPAPGRSGSESTPGRRGRSWRAGLYVLIWTLIGVIFVGPFVLRHTAEGASPPWNEVVSHFVGWYLWGLLFPFIWRLTRRWPFDRARWPAWLGRNLALGLAFSLVYEALNLVKYIVLTGPVDDPLLRGWNHLRAGIWYYLLVYFAIVAVIQLTTYYEKLRDHELVASRLEGQLAQANLQMLKMQLHPHFLFNTLNAISALMHRDVDAADKMISQLSDLLRMALEKDDRHQIRLDKELDFLHRYLAIEQIRFRDRLKVEIDVEPACLAAQVPRLILQPLVENSIRHGIAMRSAAGRLGITAVRKDDRLAMTVADDGPGLAPNRPLRPGVGLANTQARLEQLYGEDYTLEFVNADGGGFEVHVEIPFEEKPRLTG